MTMYISNAFSMKMIERNCSIKITFVDREYFDFIKEFGYSIVGHKPVADYLGVKFNRETVTLKRGDSLVVYSESKQRNGEGTFEYVTPVEEQFYLLEVE